MKHLLRSHNFYVILLADVAMIIASLFLAYSVRFEFRISEREWQGFLHVLPLVLAVKLSAFSLFHLYRGMWRYTSLVDLLNVIKASIVSTLFINFAILALYRFQGFSRSVFIIDWALTLISIGGIRLGVRLFFARKLFNEIFPSFTPLNDSRKNVLIIGAGNAGEQIVREMLDSPAWRIAPSGFLDDHPDKQGKAIHGVRVLGTISELKSFSHLFDEILIAIPSATGEQMRKITMFCKQTGKPFRTLPSINELINGSVSLQFVRNVSMQDLLRREEVRLERDDIAHYLRGKCVLITGAGGSIGSELARQVCQFQPQRVVMLDVSEYNLFQIDMQARKRFEQVEIVGALADIRNADALRRVFERYAPHVVFHAAAYKHVPMQELHSWEAVMNNVIGTKNLAQLAKEFRAERFVLVSTDKAVRPTNVMGATKRVAEKIVTSVCASCATRFMAVRFGNVLGSSGSVVPIFQEQIASGGPLTITHPDITRFFMTIPEAAQLILQAGSMGTGREIFILDMGKPVRILDLAHDLIRLYGYEPERDIAIKYTGLRPGEKLYEELITEGEGIVPTGHRKIMVLRGDADEWAQLECQIEQLAAAGHAFDAVRIKRLLAEIVPEYTPQSVEHHAPVKSHASKSADLRSHQSLGIFHPVSPSPFYS